jgi:hypothetical protein
MKLLFPAFSGDAKMMFGDRTFGVDEEGNRVLVGLTAEETRELLELTDTIASASPQQSLSVFNYSSHAAMRWRELMGKHTVGLSQFLLASKVQH